MFVWISFRDLAANQSLFLEWIVLIASLVPALLTHREFCEKIREAKGFKKGMRRAELGFLWLLPVLVFASTKASEWSSEIAARQTNIILENQSNRLAHAEIQLKGASNDLAVATRDAAEARRISEQQKSRGFSEEQKANAGVYLKQYAGTKIIIDASGDDAEAVTFANILNDLLVSCGWQSKRSGWRLVAGTPIGVYITVHRASDADALAVVSLNAFLTSCGIRSEYGRSREPSDSDISVLIGAKPPQ
jgi:hypothetical protein